jgi:hypothetical protein
MGPGSYSLYARAVTLRRAVTAPVIEPMSVGLLTSAPDPDGFRCEELRAPGYARQPITFLPPVGNVVGGKQLSAHRVSFSDIGPDAYGCTHAALFDENGEVFAYSWISRSAASFGSAEVAFEPGQIQLRF